jgi:predicted Zn-dependent protease
MNAPIPASRRASIGWRIASTLSRAVVAIAVALPIAATTTGCAHNPATGRTYFQSFNREESIQLGKEVAPELIAEYGGAIKDPTINTYVRNVGMSMVQYTEGDYATLPWEFTVLNSDIINAFALPGGQVFISRGLLEQMSTEAQMAGVLGHEIGHVTAEHINERMFRQTMLEIGMIGIAMADEDLAELAVPAVSVGGGVLLLSFDRNQELESDRLGMRYMTKAGYNPRAQLEVMEILGADSEDESKLSEFLSTHPHSKTRISKIKDLLKTTYAHTQGNPEYGEFPERYQSQMLSRLRTLPPPPKTSERRRRALMMPALAEGESLPPELALALNASWCSTCWSELQTLLGDEAEAVR